MTLTSVLATLAGACARDDEPAPSVSASGSPQRAAEAARPVALARRVATGQACSGAGARAALGIDGQARGRTTPPAELGDAYGELGLILMAAEYCEAAASCYLTAQALVPDDARWPYYLGHLYRIKGEATKGAEFFSRALELRPADAPTLIWLAGRRT